MPVASPDRAYRPRTEGLFAQIEHVRTAGDYWEVHSRDGLRTRYGTPRPAGADETWRDPAVIADPGPAGIFTWKITETTDPLGNVVRYSYLRDRGSTARAHAGTSRWWPASTTPTTATGTRPAFLVGVEFDYETAARPVLRLPRRIRDPQHAALPDDPHRHQRRRRRAPGRARIPVQLPAGAVQRGVAAHRGGRRRDRRGAVEEHLPAARRSATPGSTRPGAGSARSAGPACPALDDRNVALVDLSGSGLPDVVQLGAAPRYWSNRGAGRFALPRPIDEAPPHGLGEPGVRFLDANGDGRADLMITANGQAGYFPMTFPGGWSRRSFQPYPRPPASGWTTRAWFWSTSTATGSPTCSPRAAAGCSAGSTTPTPGVAWRLRLRAPARISTSPTRASGWPT